MKFRYDDKESVDSYKKSAYLETIKELGDKSKSGQLEIPIIEIAVAVQTGEIHEWSCFKAAYSKNLSQYLKGRTTPIVHRVGSNFIPIPARKIFGEIRGNLEKKDPVGSI